MCSAWYLVGHNGWRILRLRVLVERPTIVIVAGGVSVGFVVAGQGRQAGPGLARRGLA